MKLKVGKMFSRLIIFGLLIAILMMLVKGRSSNYYAGSPIDTLMGAAAKAGPLDIFGTKNDLKCVPGPDKDAGYYTQDLTPGGKCGDQDFVHNQMRDWTINNGIGGSLFERLG